MAGGLLAKFNLSILNPNNKSSLNINRIYLISIQDIFIKINTVYFLVQFGFSDFSTLGHPNVDFNIDIGRRKRKLVP